MKVGEVIQRVEYVIYNDYKKDYNQISRRYIYNVLSGMRAKFLSQRVTAKQTLSSWEYQTLRCIELEDISREQCPCVVSDNCLTLKRTKCPLPKILVSLDKHIIRNVSNSNGNVKIDITSHNSAKYRKYGKYAAKKPYAYFFDGYLYIENCHFDVINIEAVFEDPIEAEVFGIQNNACHDDCHCDQCIDYMDIEFPMSSTYIDGLVLSAVQDIMGLKIMQEAQKKKSKKSSDEDEE